MAHHGRRTWLLSAAAWAACARRSAAIRLLTFPESYGHHLSIGKGFYSARGLEVTADYFQSFPKMMEALLAGGGDIATAYFDALLPLLAEARDVVAFVCLAKRPGSVLAVSPVSIRRIHTVEDLAGATVGIPGPGSSSHHLLNAILRKRGVPPDRVNVAAIGVAAGAIAAMEHGKVDAAMLTNLGLSSLRLRFPAIAVLADLRTPDGCREFLGAEEYPSLCLAARRQWLDRHHDAARRFAAAFLEANRWMASHTPEEILLALPEQAHAENAAADVNAIQGMLPTLNTDGRIPREALRAVIDVVSASVDNVRDAKIDYFRGFTAEIL